MVEYIPFHKNCKNMTVIGELDITPDGVGCKINDYLLVMYYPCNSLEEMQQIQEHGFQLVDGKLGKGIYMYRKYEDAIAINSTYIIFARVTKGNFKTIKNEGIESLDITGLDRAELIEGNTIIDCVYNSANIDVIALLEFEQ
ncbi:PARP catalytic domain-containing protein [Entamoeba marina]